MATLFSEERGEMGLISQMIIEEITNWDLVELLPHPFGGVDIRVKRKSIGHALRLIEKAIEQGTELYISNQGIRITISQYQF